MRMKRSWIGLRVWKEFSRAFFCLRISPPRQRTAKNIQKLIRFATLKWSWCGIRRFSFPFHGEIASTPEELLFRCGMLKVIVPGRLKAHFIRPFPSFKVFVKQKSSEHTIKKAEQNHRSHQWVNFDYEALVLRQRCEKRRDPFPFPLAALGLPRVAVPCPHRPPLSTAWWQNNMRCPCSTRPARWLDQWFKNVRYLSEISIDIWNIVVHMISFQVGMKIHESHWELHFRGVLVGLSCLG